MDSIKLENKTPNEILEILGNIFETCNESGDMLSLQEGIKLSREVNLDHFDCFSEAMYYYFVGNAWSYLQRLKYPAEELVFESEEIEEQIKCYRKAYTLIKECDDIFNKCQILTNMGNLFSHIGRFSEAQEYFNLCLDIHSRFGMAIGNKGFGLFYYARVIYDPGHQFIFLQYARKYLAESLKSPMVYQEAKQAFYNIIQQIEILYPDDKLNDFKAYDDFYKGLSKQEMLYRQWGVENRLFINPLNDVFDLSIVAHDCLHLPNMVLSLNEQPIYHTFFNQLKQEYVSARYLYYEALSDKKPHFSDKEVALVDTLDYASYSLTLEKVKIVFKICYSLFDKIAYLINLYCKLGHDPDKVNFRNIWYVNRDKKKGLLENIKLSENWALRGLFWLSKDFDEKGFETSIEPESKEISTIRNYLEHKSFKIIEPADPLWTDKTETYHIERSLFYGKTLKLLKLSRSAIMYVSFLIYDEENRRKSNDKKGITLPVNFSNIRDSDKV